MADELARLYALITANVKCWSENSGFAGRTNNDESLLRRHPGRAPRHRPLRAVGLGDRQLLRRGASARRPRNVSAAARPTAPTWAARRRPRSCCAPGWPRRWRGSTPTCRPRRWRWPSRSCAATAARSARWQANREIYDLLRDGVRVKCSRARHAPQARGARRSGDGDEETVTVRVIDWDHPDRNDFFLASQFWITGEIYKRRADLVGFVNGLPLVFIELKASHKRLEHAFRDNLRDYKTAIPQLFRYNAFIILSNGSASKIGTLSSRWEHFTDWKKINSEGEQGVVSLETMLRGTCDPARLLDLVENFTLFVEERGGTIKLIAKNHQYLGVNNAIAAVASRLAATGEGPG